VISSMYLGAVLKKVHDIDDVLDYKCFHDCVQICFPKIIRLAMHCGTSCVAYQYATSRTMNTGSEM
jgi:hypothetical protein